MSPLEALIALNMLPRMGPIRIRRLLAHLGDAESVLKASSHRLQQVEGVGPELAGIIQSWETHADLSAELKEISSRGLTILTEDSSEWPDTLRNQADAPIVLYVWGNITAQDAHSIAVVGSRRTSHYGRDVTKKIT